MANTEGVQFTSDSADRIAKVVRIVEAGSRDSSGLRFDPRLESLASRLRLGTFTGSWNVAEFKVVTLLDSTHTVNVYNWTTSVVADDESCERKVVFSKVKGTASLVQVEFQPTCETCLLSFGGVDLTALPGYSGGAVQLLGHTESACLQWYSITECATATT